MISVPDKYMFEVNYEFLTVRELNFLLSNYYEGHCDADKHTVVVVRKKT